MADGSNGKTLALTKAGAGTLVLSSTNTSTGGYNLNGGILSLGNAGALGSSGTLSFGGGTLQDSSSNTADYSNRYSNAASQAYSIDTNGQSVSFGTGLSSTGGTLTKLGAGTLTLAAANTYTGATTVSGGTLRVTGSIASPASTMTVGNVAGNAVLNVTGSDSQVNYIVGGANGAVGAIYISGAGTVTGTAADNGQNFLLGNAAGSYGYVNVGAGATLTENELAVGSINAAGNALIDVSGTLNNSGGWLVMSRSGAAQTGVLNMFSGSTVKYGGGGLVMNWGAGQTAVVNVQGGLLQTTNNIGINLNQSNNATNTGILSLNGGVVQPSNVFAPANGTAILNFNGGILKANTANAIFISTPVKTYVYSSGGTIDNNGVAITIPAAILAPSGNGVTSISSFTPGAGYVAAPILTVNRGVGDTTGIGATAIAAIDPTTGQVTGITITNPGTGYTATPTFGAHRRRRLDARHDHRRHADCECQRRYDVPRRWRDYAHRSQQLHRHDDLRRRHGQCRRLGHTRGQRSLRRQWPAHLHRRHAAILGRQSARLLQPHRE